MTDPLPFLLAREKRQIDYKDSDCVSFIADWLRHCRSPDWRQFVDFRKAYEFDGKSGLRMLLEDLGVMTEGMLDSKKAKAFLDARLQPKTGKPGTGDVVLVNEGARFAFLIQSVSASGCYGISREGVPALVTVNELDRVGAWSIRLH